MKVLELKNIVFQYKKNVVLRNISCSFEKGKIYSIIGHNGAGKTTFIRLCLGLITPKQGEINYFNYPTISYMPDCGGLYELLTVEQNLKTFLNLHQVPKEEQNNFIEMNLQKWNLRSQRKMLVKHLSSGQKQRLSFIVATVNQPDIYFLDEPSNGIDISSQELLCRYLTELKAMNCTVIISSHNINMIEEVSDEVMIFNEHEIVYKGIIDDIHNLKELYQKYACERDEEV